MTSFGDQLADLYRTCIDLRNRFATIERDAEHIQEISMNASVVAGQTGRYMRVFNEIAQQIALTSKRSFHRTTTMRYEVNQIVNFNLQALITERRLQQFVMANPGIKQQRNDLLVNKTMRGYTKQIQGTMHVIYKHINVTEALLKTILQYQYRTFAALNALRIEAINLHGTEYSAIITLSDSLTDIVDNSSHRMEDILRTLKQIKTKAHKVAQDANEEMHYANLHAA